MNSDFWLSISFINSGSLTSGYDREVSHLSFCGGDIFGDVATGIIWLENKVSLGEGDTFMEKTML